MAENDPIIIPLYGCIAAALHNKAWRVLLAYGKFLFIQAWFTTPM